MKQMLRMVPCLVALVLLAAPAGAQVEVTTADLDRLQDLVYQVSNDVSQLRSRDTQRAERLQRELDELREEVIYLRVKLRKNELVSRAEYDALRRQIEDVRSRAAGSVPRGSGTSATAGGETGPYTVDVGTELDVRLQTRLDSETAQVEDRFEATTVADLYKGDRLLIPAGSILRGVVSSVDRASRTDRKGELTVHFDQITVGGRSYPLRATVTQALESEGIRGEAAKIGTGAGVGAIIGGILGGFKGALAGILIGAGGTIAATEGKDVELEPGTILRVRLDTPLTVSAGR